MMCHGAVVEMLADVPCHPGYSARVPEPHGNAGRIGCETKNIEWRVVLVEWRCACLGCFIENTDRLVGLCRVFLGWLAKDVGKDVFQHGLLFRPKNSGTVADL